MQELKLANGGLSHHPPSNPPTATHIYPPFFFFFNDTPPTEIYPLPLHDALPISSIRSSPPRPDRISSPPRPRMRSARLPPVQVSAKIVPTKKVGSNTCARTTCPEPSPRPDRKSTRLNSSHSQISYAVFCLKKKKR